MEVKSLQEKVCRRFCRYYKPSKDESLACMGYLVIESLSKRGRPVAFPESAGNGVASVARLIGSMCIRCPFYEDGCDFVQDVPGSSACGGFVVLDHMCETGVLSAEDIEDIIESMN